ncbi:MAG: succinate dehydrogenase / fumarate reductase membrane anchor subunit [Alteromonadaceae bacterium]|jgi:succinate dehydrogenase / fumarate reductase membrane anchor subunit
MDVNQASLKRNGIQDFISLRATGVILTCYVLCITGFFVTTPDVTYDIWKGMFSGMAMKIFTLLALVCVSIHARIGMWQVATDYIKNTKARAVLQFFVSVLSFVYVAAGLFVLWGV